MLHKTKSFLAFAFVICMLQSSDNNRLPIRNFYQSALEALFLYTKLDCVAFKETDLVFLFE